MSPTPHVLAVRARRALTRPAVRRLCVALLAAATALAVARSLDAAAGARSRWGEARPVAVATRDLAPGDVVDAGGAEVRTLPRAAVAPAALDRVPDGAVVRHPVAAGEPLVPSRLAPHGLAGAAALVPPGARAVAVPLGPAGAPPVAPGDLVDLLAVVPSAGFGGAGAAGGEPAYALAERAAVVAVADNAVTVAVPEADLARVAWALGHGTVVLALAGV